MNTHAISSVSGSAVLGDRSQLLRPRVPGRAARLATPVVAQAWKKDNEAARLDAKSFVKNGACVLASLAAAQLMLGGSAFAEAAPQVQQAVPELAQATPNPSSSNLGPNEVSPESIDQISAYASDQDKFSPGRAGTTFGDPEAAAKGNTSEEAQFKKSAGDFSRDTSGGGVKDIGQTPPSLTEKVKETFGLSEAGLPNPASSNLGPNEVSPDTIDQISAYASDQDKFSPGRAGTTFGDPEAAAKGDTSEETQFKKSAGDFSRDTSGGGVKDIGNTPPSLVEKVKDTFGLSEVNPDSQNLGPNEVGQEAIDRIVPNASSFDKAAPGRSGSNQFEGAAAAGRDSAVDRTKDTLTQAVGSINPGNKAPSQSNAGGLLGRLKSIFNLGEASNPQNPSVNDVSKDIAKRLGGGGGISQIDEQSPGRATTQQGGTQEVGQGVNNLKRAVKEGADKVGDVGNLGDKLKQALPDLSDLPSAGDAVQAGKDLIGKLPTADDVQGQGGKPDLLEQGIRGALNKAPDDISNPKGAPYTKAASDAIKEKVGEVFSGDK